MNKVLSLLGLAFRSGNLNARPRRDNTLFIKFFGLLYFNVSVD